VTDQEEPVVAFDQPQHLVRGGTETDVGTRRSYECSREQTSDASLDGLESVTGSACGRVAGNQEQHP